jgi:hypothetical protein
VTDVYFLTVLGVGAGEPVFKRVLSRITFLRLFFVNITIAAEWLIKTQPDIPPTSAMIEYLQSLGHCCFFLQGDRLTSLALPPLRTTPLTQSAALSYCPAADHAVNRRVVGMGCICDNDNTLPKLSVVRTISH